MGVTNVNGQNQINLVKLALAKKGKVTTDNKPQYLQMTGSIFNAPKARTTSATLADLNTSRSLADLNRRSVNSNKTNNNNNIDNASDGKAAAANAEKEAGNVKALTSETQNNTRTVNEFANESSKLQKSIKTSDKKFQQKLRAQENQLKEDNIKLSKMIKENEELDLEVTNASNELQTLLASNSASVGNGGGSSDRIKELRTLIGSKTVLMQANGKTIYSLQRSSNRTLTRMNRTNRAYLKTQNKNIKNIEQQESSTDKIIKVANKIEQISALTAQVGQLVNMAGVALVALGSATSWSGGAALIAAGQVMQKVGKVTETVGQYGQTAANVTKTAAYAADGNIMGAMQSAAAAAQTGAAAVKSTQNMSKAFDQIDASAQEATQKLAANQVAAETVEAQQNEAMEKLAGEGVVEQFTKDGKVDYDALEKHLNKNGISDAAIENEAFGGMKAKDAKKWISNDLRSQMGAKNSEIVTNGKWSRTQLESYKQQLTANGENSIANQSLTNATNRYEEIRIAAFNENQIVANADGTFTQSKLDDGYVTTKTISSRKAGRIVRNSFKNEIPEYKPKHSVNMGGLLKEFGNGIMSTAAMLAQNDQMATQNKNAKRNIAPMRYDARMQRIINSNQRRRAAYA